MTDKPGHSRKALLIVLLVAIALTVLAVAKYKEFAAGFYCGTGDYKRNKGLYDDAIKDYDKTLALDPKWVGAYVCRGLAYISKRQYDQAIKDFDQAITLGPGFADGYAGRARAFAGLKQYDKAWTDVKACRDRGGRPSEEFIKNLTTASGRPE